MTFTRKNSTSIWLPKKFIAKPPSLLHPEYDRSHNLSNSLWNALDRVNVLGDNIRYGHTGCVNALSWAKDGELLLSGGDDTTVRIWRLDGTFVDQDYPFVCQSVINTGHRANIFNTHMLPYSSRIVTAAGDRQVRVFDIGTASNSLSDGIETEYSSRQSCIQVFRCHEGRAKRIVTEESPDLFLSVAEDGAVRQHDLRNPHNCRGSCPTPLMRVDHELSTLSLSPLTPYQFIVAGESPYGYLFDRRQTGRVLQDEWGMVSRPGEGVTTCVRRFGRPQKPSSEPNRGCALITGARISAFNGHEVLLSYSGDGVYLFSCHDSPHVKDDLSSSTTSVLASNAKRRKLEKNVTMPSNDVEQCNMLSPPEREDSAAASASLEDADAGADVEMENNEDSDYEDDDIVAFAQLEGFFAGSATTDEVDYEPHAPVVYPRRRYIGARNVATIKDVNFLGPFDEWITSGSDDGNFFIWEKSSGKVHGIYEGDGNVVNVIEPHPHLPLVAVSGIDTTVKLFAPASRLSPFSRLSNAQQIMDTNARMSRTRMVRYNFSALLAEARAAIGAEDVNLPECSNQ